MIWQMIYIIAAIIQYLHPKYLIVGFATSIGMFLLFSQLENPAADIDRETGCYNLELLKKILLNSYKNGHSFSAVDMVLKPAEGRWNEHERKAAVTQAAEVLYPLKKATAFHILSNEFVVIFPDPDTLNETFDSMRGELKKRLTDLDDRIEVFYQPIYDLDHHNFPSAEALVRLRQTDGSLLPPGKFIPVAEDSGLIRSLGLRVLEKVCAFIRQGAASASGLQSIHVNLSAVQLDESRLAAQISSLFSRYSIKPGQINFEITESAKIGKKKNAYSTLEHLSALGMPLSLDDFGTQRSNLDYFIELPISVVKFDRTFTQSYFTNEKTKYVMQSVIEMFRNQGLSIVIEGIETKDEFDLIRKLPINCIQGYYFSRPLPENEFLQFLKASRNHAKV